MRTNPNCHSRAAVLRSFAAFAEADDKIFAELDEKGIHKQLPAGLMTSLQGSDSEFFPIVLDGSARVFTMGENGNEITLYRLNPGEGCVLAAASILSSLPLPAFAITETDGEYLMVPAEVFHGWFDHQDFWRKFVFSLISSNLAQVIAVTNATAFRRLDARVAAHLLATSGGEEIATTHQGIAMELGSSREVISRVLKSLEVEGLVALARGSVRILDRQGLGAKAEDS